MYKGTPIRLSVDFSAETWKTRRMWDNIFKVLKEIIVNQEFSPCQNCPSELKEIKEFSTTTKAEMLKGILQAEVKGC